MNTPDMERLKQQLDQIDRRGYKAYKQIQGEYCFPGYQLRIDHVQGDPFADPSRCRIFINSNIIKLDAALYANRIRTIALEDYLGRCFSVALKRCVKGKRGSGRSGEVSMAEYGQQVLVRNAVLVKEGAVEIRFRLALPGDGRSVNARQAKVMFFDELVKAVQALLKSVQKNAIMMQQHIDSIEDQQHMRQQLNSKNLVAFIADGAVLPRKSGIDDRPLQAGVPFLAPKSMAVILDRLHGEPLRGLGIAKGVTLIVGGGYHGKSTLLHAVERGVYDHIPGDGRECVVTDFSAFKIRAEDGRAITGVDISPFVNNLPQGKDTRCFSSQNASGSTSQAANIIEALETGTKTLLIDEDTSATNFMIRDERMQALVAKDKEPITPLVQRVRGLYQHNGISTVLVMGGSGDYFAMADAVVMMDNYQPYDMTQQAKALAQTSMLQQDSVMDIHTHVRVPHSHSLSAQTTQGKDKIQAFGRRSLRYGEQEIDLARVEQVVDTAQLVAIGYLIRFYKQHYSNEKIDLVSGLSNALEDVEKNGLDKLTPYIVGSLAVPRLQELAAVVNRMRGLKLINVEGG